MSDIRNPAAPVLRFSIRFLLLGCVLLQASGCARLADSPLRAPQEFGSTYLKYLARAERGDSESQNVVGFMLYHGEGVTIDRSGARAWFEQAAIGGSERAMRNLAALAAHRATSATSPARGSAATTRTKASSDGERLFSKFCGGCHGFNGIASYPEAPSFALGERLDRADADLMHSLRDGHAAMPSWEDKLPQHDLRLILAAIRRLPARYDAGIDASMNDAPDFYFLFGPMEAR